MVSGSWTTCSRHAGPYRSLKYSGVWVLRRLLSHRTGVPYGHRRNTSSRFTSWILVWWRFSVSPIQHRVGGPGRGSLCVNWPKHPGDHRLWPEPV